MVDLATLFAPGLRVLTDEGRLTPLGETPPSIEGAGALYVVDLEMSGPNASHHEVLDIGGVRASLSPRLPEEEAWGARVKPKHIGNAVVGALKVVGYNSRAWKDALDLEVALARFEQVGKGGIVTGWGIGQDMAFLVESFRRVGRTWPFAPIALDVQYVARKVLKGTGDVDHFNLGHVADRLGIGRLGEHGALADAYATYDVLLKLVERADAEVPAG